MSAKWIGHARAVARAYRSLSERAPGAVAELRQMRSMLDDLVGAWDGPRDARVIRYPREIALLMGRPDLARSVEHAVSCR
jgi:hypothetical protein